MSIPYIEQIPSSDRYQFKVQVQSFQAPGRFVLGFRDDIKVIGSQAFLKYLQSKMKKEEWGLYSVSLKMEVIDIWFKNIQTY